MQHFTDTYVSVQGGILYGTCSGALGNVKILETNTDLLINNNNIISIIYQGW